MASGAQLSFKDALDQYHRSRSELDSKSEEQAIDRAQRRVDRALDDLLLTPSYSIGAFGEKMKILKAEYGLEAQPRHMAAIYADTAILVALYADLVVQSMPLR
jgi:hypothetical protein